MTEQHETVKQVVDVVAVGVTAGSLVQALPAIAAVLSILWALIRIWESDTVRGWTNRRTPRS